MNVLVLGAGKMLSAILIGLKQTEDLSSWGIYSPSGTSASSLSAEVGAKWVKDLDLAQADYVFVGCKPQQLKELKLSLGERFKDATFVSVLAAISEKEQREILGVEKLIRVMPNLPVKFNKGVSLLSSESAPAELKVIQKLFSKVGVSLTLSEDELEELTLLTGSGPAFFYEFTQNLAQGFTSLNQEKREELARQVLIGAAFAVESSPEKLETLTSAVTSKGGVTIAVLEKWRESKLMAFLKEGFTAGKKRSEELKEIIRRS